jgi:hypothetical protein
MLQTQLNPAPKVRKIRFKCNCSAVKGQKFVENKHRSFRDLSAAWQLAQNEREPEENLPLGIILCAGKNSEQIELLELGTAGIHVAEYLTVLPPPEVLREKLHKAIETVRARIEARTDDRGTEE